MGVKEVAVIERADYYIEKVRYTKDHSRIIWVSVREDSSKRLSGPYNMVRKKIMSLIHDGKRFMTIYRNDEGKFRKGQNILLISVQGKEFLRTNADPMEQDLLADLPEY